MSKKDISIKTQMPLKAVKEIIVWKTIAINLLGNHI
jgi:hypothetical protein